MQGTVTRYSFATSVCINFSQRILYEISNFSSIVSFLLLPLLFLFPMVISLLNSFATSFLLPTTFISARCFSFFAYLSINYSFFSPSFFSFFSIFIAALINVWRSLVIYAPILLSYRSLIFQSSRFSSSYSFKRSLVEKRGSQSEFLFLPAAGRVLYAKYISMLMECS